MILNLVSLALYLNNQSLRRYEMGSKARRRALREKRREVKEKRASRASSTPTFIEQLADSVDFNPRSLTKSARTVLGR